MASNVWIYKRDAPHDQVERREVWGRKPAGDACKECPLQKNICVPPERHEGAKIAIVGEGPGPSELIEGRPFVGPSGRLLNHLNAKIGFKRSDVHWTNATLCQGKESELAAARKACQARLDAELQEAGIEHVIALGAHALHATAHTPRKPRILHYRGSVIHDTASERTVFPMVHPAFVLRAPQWEPVMLTDYERASRIIREGYQLPERMNGRSMRVPHTLTALRAELKRMGATVSVDVETTGLDATETGLVCLGISDGQHTVVVPWSKDKTGTCCYYGLKTQPKVAALLSEFFASRTAVTHNGPMFDHIVLARHGIKLAKWEDTLLAHHAFASHMPKRLSHVVSMYVDVPPWKDEKHAEQLREYYRYNARDALYTKLAWDGMQEDLADEQQIYEQDKIAAELCRSMQVVGFRFDKTKAKWLRRKLKRVETAAQAKADKLFGRNLNLLSQLQLREAFFEELSAPVFFKSEKTNLPALNVNALRAYAALGDTSISKRVGDFAKLNKLSECVLALRKARKARSTYIDAIVTDANSRVHPIWLSYGAVSGRFACQKPNIMNLPRPENDPVAEFGGIRSLYIAAPGKVLVAFDFAQLEMRIAAYVSGDEAMISACESSDLHAGNAAVIFGEAFTKLDKVKDEKEYKTFRNLAKQSGFAVAYMAGASTVYARIVAAGIPITLMQTERMLASMRKAFSTYYNYQEALLLQTIRLGYIRIPISNRKRWLGHAPAPPETANTPIQGGAAGLMNMVLPRIVRQLPPDCELVAQVHDAAYFEVPSRRADEVVALCKEETSRPVLINGRNVVFPTDTKIGERWSEL